MQRKVTEKAGTLPFLQTVPWKRQQSQSCPEIIEKRAKLRPSPGTKAIESIESYCKIPTPNQSNKWHQPSYLSSTANKLPKHLIYFHEHPRLFLQHHLPQKIKDCCREDTRKTFSPPGLNTRAIIIPVIPKLLDYVLLFASNELTHNQERIFSCFIQFLLQSCAVFRLIMCVSVRPHAPAQRYVTS